MKKVLLYSGGMDSYIIKRLWKPDVCLYINYGTEQNKNEIKKLPDDVIVKEVNLSEYIQNDGFKTIPLRNLLFACIGVNYGDVIAIGGVKGDAHFDKTKVFCAMTTFLFNSVLLRDKFKHKVRVCVPYRNYTKEELCEMFFADGGTEDELINKSWSCYYPKEDGTECGECWACTRKKQAIKNAQKEIKKQKMYISTNGEYVDIEKHINDGANSRKK